MQWHVVSGGALKPCDSQRFSYSLGVFNPNFDVNFLNFGVNFWRLKMKDYIISEGPLGVNIRLPFFLYLDLEKGVYVTVQIFVIS